MTGMCVRMIWDDACGEGECAEIHRDRLRWNYHAYESPEAAELRIRQANAIKQESRP